MAPEMFQDSGYTHLVDAWSLGCLIYELVCGVPPFTGDTPEEVFASILVRTSNNGDVHVLSSSF